MNKFSFRRLGVKNGGASVYHKSNRETFCEIGDSVRGKDVYIIQSGTKYDADTLLKYPLIHRCHF
jgi:phosphoribosylpyrophosphate synthetase